METAAEEAIVQGASEIRLQDENEKSQQRQNLNWWTSTSRISNTGSQAKDVTANFVEAASALSIGQLVKDEYFTLFEAVGALEIMDPKMDSGYLAPGETLEDDYDVLRTLLPEEVVGIMDQMLCYEIAWHMGHPLSQTLFTSLYIDRLLWPEPKTLEEACFARSGELSSDNPLLHLVLRVYCIALTKTCDLVHGRIIRETYYEEEDFVTNLYNRKLLSDCATVDIEKLLDLAIEWVNGPGRSILEALVDAITERLRFRKLFLRAITQDADLISQQKTNPIWDECSDALPKLLQSHNSGVPIEGAFSEKIQRRLASTVPPRPMVKISFDDACAHLNRLCKDGNHVAKVLDCQGGSNILTFVLTFQAQKPQPSVYIRCLLQSLILDEMRVLGTMSIQQLILEDLAEIVLPADILVDPGNADVEPPQDPRFQIAKRMEKFVSRVGQSYLDISRALTMNRSRIRRMLCHTIMDWDNIQVDAEELDMELRPYTKEEPMVDRRIEEEEVWSFPLSSWAYYQKLHQMEWIVQLGFELQIYQVNEMAGMYWYLQHLANTRLHHLQRIRGFTIRRQKSITTPTPQQTAAFARSFSFLSFAMLETSAIQSFADALSCLYTSLSQLSLLPSHPNPPYSTPSLRHSLRMRPFLPISLPTVPTFPEFASLVSPFPFPPSDPSPPSNSNPTNPKLDTSTLNTLLLSADHALKAARKESEEVSKASAETARCLGVEGMWREGVRNVLRSVIAGSIAVAGVRTWIAEGGLEGKAGRLKVEVGGVKGYHDWWVVPRVVRESQ